jgi:hypothetical protein
VALAIAAAAMALAAAPAPAVVPPRDCGPMEVKGERYKIKADQLRCKPARRYALDYLKRGDKPRGYTCQKGDRGSKLEFRCYKGIKEFFAIRRRG